MRILLIMFASFLISGIAEAKWRPLTEKELISESSIIVIAEFENLTEKKESYYKEQKAKFKILKSIKGNKTDAITVKGTTQHICAPVVAFTGKETGKFILFLSQDGDLFVPTNGCYSIIQITDGKIPWFIPGQEETFSPIRSSISVEAVIKRITAEQGTGAR